MLELSKQSVTIAHVNSRLQMHGDEEVLAVDIKMSADMSNKMLDELSPGLRVALYSGGAQADVEEDHLSQVRFPQMPHVDWGDGLEEAEFTIHGGRGGETLKFSADVNNLRLTPKDGGTVAVSFRAQILPSPEEVGTITGMLGQKVKVSVKAAEVPDDPPLE